MKEIYKPKILLVEDEPTLSMILKDTLEDEGFDLIHATNGRSGLASFHKNAPDLVIADVMMPGMDGFEMVKKIRNSDKTTPVLFLTARSSIEDLVEGFESGANDYLKKPFKMLELIVRVKALLNRMLVEKEEDCIFEIGEFTFNSTNQLLSHYEKQAELSFMESELLRHLCINFNEVAEINYLLNTVWNNDSYYNRNNLHGFIHKLRKILSADERIKILNIRGLGYKLTLQE